MSPALLVIVLVSAAAFGFGVGYSMGMAVRLPPRPVYRRVVEREGAVPEVVHLECGHSYQVIRHRIDHVPCQQCAEKAELSPARPPDGESRKQNIKA